MPGTQRVRHGVGAWRANGCLTGRRACAGALSVRRARCSRMVCVSQRGAAAGGRWKAVRLQAGAGRAAWSCQPACKKQGARPPVVLETALRGQIDARVAAGWRQRPEGSVVWLWCCRTFGDCRAGLGRAAAVLPGAAGDHSSRRRVSTALRNSSTPSAGTLPRVQVGWFVGWLKASGWGMRPRMRPVGSVRPAIPRGEPLGLAG